MAIDRRIRVLLLGPELAAVSGVSTHLTQLFGSQLAHDYELQQFVVGSEGRRETATRRVLRLMLSPFTLAVKIIRFRPDIVHINASSDHKSFPRDATYMMVARTFRRIVVFQIHGGEQPQNLYRNKFVSDQFVRRVLQIPSVIVLLSKAELEAYSQFVPGTRIQLIANGIAKGPKETLGGRTVKAAPLQLVFVGRLVPTKGALECIAAAALLRDSGRQFKLTIAGAGPQEAILREQSENLIEEGLVEFVGVKSGDAKEKLWRESDLFVFPTNHLEGLPYVLLESMQSGAVPITTRVGAQPDVIEQGVHGLFIPPGDPQALFEAIVTLDDNRQGLATMSQQCVLRIHRDYSVDRVSTEFDKLYRSLTAARHHRNRN